MNNKLLMFPEFARSAKALFEAKPTETTEYAKYITAVGDGRYSFSREKPENCYSLSLASLDMARKSGREIGMLEIRCDYLQQLSAMQRAEGADKQQLQLGTISANTTPVKITASHLQKSVEAELCSILSNEQHTSVLFSDHLLSAHGLLNTVSAKLQNPMTTMLLTTGQIKSMGFTIRADSRPIMIFTPVVKSFFERGGKLLPMAEATENDQLELATGGLTATRSVHYAVDQYYDIGDLRITEAQKAKLLATSHSGNVEYGHICQFASTLQNEAGVPLKVQSTPMQGMPMASLYNARENSILLNSRLHPSQRTAELIERLADAIVTTTSPSAIPLQAFEKQLLAVQLSSAWSIPHSKTAFAGLCAAFSMAQKNGGDFSLEAVTARVNRITHYITSGVSTAVQQEQQMSMQQGKEQVRGFKAQSTAEAGPLVNFLEGI